MKLIDWMRREKLDDEQVARMVGDCTGHAVKKWKYGERVPDATRILQIEKVTNGRVRLRDWSAAQESQRAAS
jgi:hypothetical protein